MSSCQICHNNWNALSTLPRVLVCGHSYCEECLKFQIQANNLFVCQPCNIQYTYWNIREAPINRTLLDIILELQQPTFLSQESNATIISNNINSNSKGIGDQIEQQLRSIENQNQRTQIDKSQNNQQVNADDMCMVDNCSNQRAYKYGKKQVFCSSCLSKSSANIFDSSPQSSNSSTNIFTTPYKDKFQSSNSYSSGQQAYNPQSNLSKRPISPNQQFPFGRPNDDSIQRSLQFSSPQTEQRPQRTLFQSPQCSNGQNSQNGVFPIFNMNQHQKQNESKQIQRQFSSNSLKY